MSKKNPIQLYAASIYIYIYTYRKSLKLNFTGVFLLTCQIERFKGTIKF